MSVEGRGGRFPEKTGALTPEGRGDRRRNKGLELGGQQHSGRGRGTSQEDGELGPQPGAQMPWRPRAEAWERKNSVSRVPWAVNHRGVPGAGGAGGVGGREGEGQFRREQRARAGREENANLGSLGIWKGVAETVPHLIFKSNKSTQSLLPWKTKADQKYESPPSEPWLRRAPPGVSQGLQASGHSARWAHPHRLCLHFWQVARRCCWSGNPTLGTTTGQQGG